MKILLWELVNSKFDLELTASSVVGVCLHDNPWLSLIYKMMEYCGNLPTLELSEARSSCRGESFMELLSTPLDGAGDGDRESKNQTQYLLPKVINC